MCSLSILYLWSPKKLKLYTIINLMKKSFFLLLLVILISNLKLHSQVTIGSGSEPSSAALLDLKTQDDPTGGITSTSGGLLLPRVKLINLDDLEPFIAGGGSSTDKMINKGLLVYNITDNTIFKPGQYTWDGAKWQITGKTYTAANGLTMTTDNKVKLGGSLSEVTNIEQNGHTFKISSRDEYSFAEFSTQNAALKLEAKNKGFMPPRVTLTGPTDKATISLSSSDAGMVVYHTGNTAMKEGLHTWNGTSWKELVTEVPSPTVSRIAEMTADANKGVNSGYSDANDTLTNGSLSLDGIRGAVTIPFEKIEIDSKGSYAFQLRLYGRIKMNKSPHVSGGIIFYFFLYKNGVLTDAAEINFYHKGAVKDEMFTSTYTLPMTAPNCEIGDKIEIKFAGYSLGSSSTHDYSENSYWNLIGYKRYGKGSAARTSLIYWKL